MEVGSMWVVPRHLESLLHILIGKPFILDEVLNSKILSKSLDGWLKEIRELDMIQSPGIPQISAYFLHHDHIEMTKTPQFSFSHPFLNHHSATSSPLFLYPSMSNKSLVKP